MHFISSRTWQQKYCGGRKMDFARVARHLLRRTSPGRKRSDRWRHALTARAVWPAARLPGQFPERVPPGNDGAALVYAKDKKKLDAATTRFVEGLSRFGHVIVRRIPLKCAPPGGKRKEPFGFRDGISQPILRGTFRAQRPFDQIHLVEPGEFILGYADNRGYIRQLEQDVEQFRHFISRAASSNFSVAKAY